MINKKLDIKKLASLYQENGNFIYIENIFEENVAQELHEHLLVLDENKLWYDVNFINNESLKSEQFEQLQKEFAYSYSKYPLYNQSHKSITSHDSQRIITHLAEDKLSQLEREIKYRSALGNFTSYFNSGEGKHIIEVLTNHQFSEDGLTSYAARSSANDFNNVHTDYMPTRLVTMVAYLSPNWSINSGGITCILDDDCENILKAYSPKFNTAIIFDVPMFHLVTPISPQCKDYRYTLTNWFHNFDKI